MGNDTDRVVSSKKLLTVTCNNCGFRLGIQTKDLDEIAAGVWGTIPCPHCKVQFNDKIKAIKESPPSGSLTHLEIRKPEH